MRKIILNGKTLLNLGVQYKNSDGTNIPFKTLLPELRQNYKLWQNALVYTGIPKTIESILVFLEMAGTRHRTNIQSIVENNNDNLLNQFEIVVMTDKEKQELFDKHQEAICNSCPWNDEPHGINSLCEGSCCDRAIDCFLDSQEAEEDKETDWRKDYANTKL